MGLCQACGYCFCAWCEQTWHGERPCQINALMEVLTEYKQVRDATCLGRERHLGKMLEGASCLRARLT